MLIGGLIIIIGSIFQYDWMILVMISTVMFLPTILHVLEIPLFSSEKKSLRLVFRWLLGFGVAIGIISIVKAPHVLVGLIQFLLGVGLYLGVGINRIRSKDMWFECKDCTYLMSINCPRFSPFILEWIRKNNPIQEFL